MPVGLHPGALLFDGTNIWVANSGAKTVTRVNAATGAVTGTFAAGNNPGALTFDGSLPKGLGHRLRVLPTFVV